MIVRRTPDGALKCAFRAFLREELMADGIASQRGQLEEVEAYVHVLIFVITAMVVISSGANCFKVEILMICVRCQASAGPSVKRAATSSELRSRFIVRSIEGILTSR